MPTSDVRDPLTPTVTSAACSSAAAAACGGGGMAHGQCAGTAEVDSLYAIAVGVAVGDGRGGGGLGWCWSTLGDW